MRRIHTTLHGALKAAQKAHLIASNPTEQITAPKFSYGEKQILTDEHLDVFMKVITEDEVWRDFFYTELTTGLRRGEICGLKWEDFDEVSGTLKICRTVYRESGSGLTAGDTETSAGTRKIVLPTSTVRVLHERKRSALTEWIFPNPLKPEQPADPSSAYRRLKILLKQAGLPSIRFHDLRHTFATHALASGVDVKTLSGILGHTRAEGYYEVFLLELTTGLRVGELMALQWDDLNFNTGELRIERQVCQSKGELLIQPPKNKASIRTVILPPAVAAALRVYKQTVSSRWMFSSPKKEDAPIAPSVVSRRLARILKHAGCKKVRFHNLRHVFAANVLEHGMDVKTLSTIIGRVSSSATLSVYAHITDDMQRQAAAKIDRASARWKQQNPHRRQNPTPR